MKKSFYSNGKLLLTGEYVVLDGVKAMAIPTSYGQSLKVVPKTAPGIHWTSLDEQGQKWFEGSYQIDMDVIKSESNDWMHLTLGNILHTARRMNPNFLADNSGLEVQAVIDFPRQWGLGTSSTLINNIAQWADVDAFALLQKSFGGSGYDIAAAQNNSPIFYQLKNDLPLVSEAKISSVIIENSFFVFLNKKQDSKLGIARYKEKGSTKEQREAITELGMNICASQEVAKLSELITEHESLTSKIVELPTVKSELFPDYQGAIKSLGAWGGDFIWVIGKESDHRYFLKKGFDTIISFEDMVL